MKQNPGIKVTEVVKQIAKLWQSLSKEEKQLYKEAAKQGKLLKFLKIYSNYVFNQIKRDMQKNSKNLLVAIKQ